MGAKNSCNCEEANGNPIQLVESAEGKPSNMGLKGLVLCSEGSGGPEFRHGVEELEDGSTYEGQFLGKSRHGNGKITWVGGDSFEGQFQRNNIEGQGAFRWASGVAYSGQWSRNELGPVGYMKWPDGRQYRGHFLRGEKHADGRLQWPDGRAYSGQWIAGKQHGYGLVSDGKGRVHLSQWDNGKLARWLPEAGLTKLSPDERLSAALASGAVRLLSAMWLLEQPDGYMLARRDELPSDAFLEPGEADALVDKRFGIVVVSYPSLGKPHPDPAGFHTRTLLKYLGKHMRYFDGFEDVGVFCDYACIPQKSADCDPRSEEDRHLRGIGLQTLGYLYGSKNSVVVKLTRVRMANLQIPLRGEASPPAYSSRGWCFVESILGGLTKDSDQLLDLGLAAKVLEEPDQGWEELRDAAISARPPPMLPEDMATALENLAFSDGDDRELVLKLYTDFFKEVAPTVIVLALAHARPDGGWGDTEVKILCRALPFYTDCKALSIANHSNIGKASLKDVRERVPSMPKLQRLVLPRHLQDSKEGQALAQEWCAMGKNPKGLVWLGLHG